MDDQILEEVSRFIDWEGNVQWFQVPLSEETAISLKLAPSWVTALTGDSTIKERVEQLWQNIAEELPRTYTVLTEKTTGLALLSTQDSGVSLIYFFETEEGLEYCRGYCPTSDLPAVAEKFPIDLALLYRIHNGFVDFASYDGGPLPVNKWQSAIDPLTNEASLIKIATDGSDAFGFDLSDEQCAAYFVCPNEEEVEEIDEPWEFLDEMIAGPLEDL